MSPFILGPPISNSTSTFTARPTLNLSTSPGEIMTTIVAQPEFAGHSVEVSRPTRPPTRAAAACTSSIDAGLSPCAASRNYASHFCSMGKSSTRRSCFRLPMLRCRFQARRRSAPLGVPLHDSQPCGCFDLDVSLYFFFFGSVSSETRQYIYPMPCLRWQR